jgi:hypothetical protein
VTALLFTPIYLHKIATYGKLKLWKAESRLVSVCLSLTLFANNFFTGAIGTFCLGVSISGYFVLPEMVLADAIEEDTKINNNESRFVNLIKENFKYNLELVSFME